MPEMNNSYAKWRNHLADNPTALAFIGLLGLCIAMALVSDRFWTWDNLNNVARQVSINAIIATGMTIVILTGGIDLSVGAVMTLSMTFCAGALLGGVPLVLAVLIGLATGAAFGALTACWSLTGSCPPSL